MQDLLKDTFTVLWGELQDVFLLHSQASGQSLLISSRHAQWKAKLGIVGRDVRLTADSSRTDVTEKHIHYVLETIS